MISSHDLLDLHWSTRDGYYIWLCGGWFYQLYQPAKNETGHFFKIMRGSTTLYCGNIPDRNAMVSLMRWLEFPKYEDLGDPWNEAFGTIPGRTQHDMPGREQLNNDGKI